jgi:hypothetical protein
MTDMINRQELITRILLLRKRNEIQAVGLYREHWKDKVNTFHRGYNDAMSEILDYIID